MSTPKKIGRRDFMKSAAITGLAGVATPSILAATTDTATSAQASACETRSWEVAPSPISAAAITETINADIVVIGAGAAGLAVAHAAAEKGAKVVLLEKTKSFAARGFANGAIGTKIHKKQGVNLDKEQIVGELIRWSSNRIHQRLIRLWANQSGEVLDYYIGLAERNGLEAVLMPETFQVSSLYKEYQTAIQFRKPGTQDLFTQGLLLGSIESEAKRLGVDVRYSTPAQQLVRDQGNGRVAAVIAKSKNGYIRVNASKSVVLTTGDYGSNREMLAAWSPLALKTEVNTYTPVGANTGDGIKMALWVGASIQDTPHPPMIHIIPFVNTDFMSSNQSWLHVNRKGLRYENEGQPLQGTVDGKFMQPGGKVWGVFDSKYAADNARFQNVMFGPMSEPVDKLEESVQKKLAFKGNTIEELAQAMDVPASELKVTVARYNEMAKKRIDKEYGKDPSLMFSIEKAPYYAVSVPAHLLVIVGGLNVNDRQQVLDKEDNEIPGLFAVGNVAGNLFANDYPLTVPGLSHGRCLTLGRILGQELAVKS